MEAMAIIFAVLQVVGLMQFVKNFTSNKYVITIGEVVLTVAFTLLNYFAKANTALSIASDVLTVFAIAQLFYDNIIALFSKLVAYIKTKITK